MDTQITQEEDQWLLLRFKVFEQQIADAFRVFRANNIEPVLIKGWAASLKYPRKHRRTFSDIDLAVDPRQYETALEIVETNNLIVDLHKSLRHLDTLEWEKLFENSVLCKVDETDVRILSEEDHLRVLCVHWLTDGGAYREKLWDIYYAVENRDPNFDWNLCLNVVSSKRRLWIIYTIGLAHRYLNLDVSKLSFREEILDFPKWLIKAVESEWSSPVKLRPIHSCINDKKEFLRQILKRIPPNAIQATIEMEGDFDNRSRIMYQIKSFRNRFNESFKRNLMTKSTKKK